MSPTQRTFFHSTLFSHYIQNSLSIDRWARPQLPVNAAFRLRIWKVKRNTQKERNKTITENELVRTIDLAQKASTRFTIKWSNIIDSAFIIKCRLTIWGLFSFNVCCVIKSDRLVRRVVGLSWVITIELWVQEGDTRWFISELSHSR